MTKTATPGNGLRARAMMVWLITVLMLLMLQSCATQSPLEMARENGVATAPNQAEVNACLQWVEKKREKEMARFDSLAPTDRSFALMHHDTMDMIKNVWGKDKNECQPGTNVWDAYIVWAKEEGATKREMVREGGATLRFASGVAGATYAVTELAAKAGDKVLGNKTGRDNNEAGEGVENSGTNTAIDTRTQQTQVQAIRGNGNIEPATATATPPPVAAEAPAVPATPTPAATVPAAAPAAP